jgi:hypothetical protein
VLKNGVELWFLTSCASIPWKHMGECVKDGIVVCSFSVSAQKYVEDEMATSCISSLSLRYCCRDGDARTCSVNDHIGRSRVSNSFSRRHRCMKSGVATRSVRRDRLGDVGAVARSCRRNRLVEFQNDRSYTLE